MSRNQLVLVVLGFMAARLVAGAYADLVPDEAYYWLWSRHLAASYYDHPPMVAWWIWLGTALFGDTPFGIRVVSILAAIPTSAAVYWTGIALFDRAVAARAVVFLNAALLIGAGGMFATPDPPSVFFWSLATLAFAMLFRNGNPAWWLAVGLCAGLGVLSKLTNLFLGPGIVLAVLADRDLRRAPLTPWPWLGALLALAVVGPMLLWNAGHDWVTFTKQMSRLSVATFQPLHIGVFVVTLFLLLNPLVAVFAGRAARAFLAPASPWRRGVGLLLATILPLLAYLAIHALRTAVAGNWAAPAYPTLALLAAVAAQSLDPAAGHRVLLRLRALALPLGAVLSAIALLLFALPAGMVSGRFDPPGLARGWPELADAAVRLARDNGAAWIATASYDATGALAWHLRDAGIPVVAVAARVRYAFAPPPDPALLGKPALLIVRGTRPRPELDRCLALKQPLGQLHRNGQPFSAFLVEGTAPRAFAAGCETADPDGDTTR
jgi:4-amino-4-deoxy-L-arabinose transferase-like glycosyltransferase